MTGTDSPTSEAEHASLYSPGPSPGGGWFWDGAQWVKGAGRSRWNDRIRVGLFGVLWLLLSCAWLPAMLTVGLPSSSPFRVSAGAFALLGLAGVLITIAWGSFLAFWRRRGWMLASCAAMAAMILGWSLVAMFGFGNPTPAVADVVAMTETSIPTIAMSCVFLLIGIGIGSSRRRRHDRLERQRWGGDVPVDQGYASRHHGSGPGT